MHDQNSLVSQLYSLYMVELFRYAVKQFRLGHEEAEDIVQLTFLTFSQQVDIRKIGNHRAYLYRMIHNKIVDHIRKTKSDRGIEDQISAHQSEEASTVNNPERSTCALQRLEIVQNTMASMPERRRVIINMSRHEHLSNVEIARRLGISEKAVRKHKIRALLDMKLAVNTASGSGSQ